MASGRSRGPLGGWPDGARRLFKTLARLLGVRFDLDIPADPSGDRLVTAVKGDEELSVQATPAAKAELGNFDPDRALDAIRRGIAMNRDLTDGKWDY